MRAGKLRHRIEIQERVPGSGEWVFFARAWAERETQMGQEQSEKSEQLLQDAEVVRFRIRYRTDLTHKMRIIWDSRAFDIQKIEELDNTRREMMLACLEVPYSG